MNDRERIEALLNRQKPDRVPHWPIVIGFCTHHAGISIADGYNNPEASLSSQRKACQDFGWVCAPHLGNPVALAPEFGGDFKWPTSEFSQAPMITRHPVDTIDDVWKLDKPDVKTAGIISVIMEFCDLATQDKTFDNEPFNPVLWGGGPFTSASNICGMDKLGRWMLKNPDAAHQLLRLSADYYVQLAEQWKDTFGTEGALPLFGDPAASNQLISPRQFEKFALPYLKELFEFIINLGYKHIFMHVCGEQNLNLPHLSQIPFGDPGIISIGHEVKLETAAKYFSNHIIMGNLEPVIIQAGTPEDVYRAAKIVIEEGKKLPGGFIFSAGCELPPKSPIENIKAMSKAIDDFGWYSK